MIWSKWVWTAKLSPLLLQVHHLFSTMTSDQVCIKVLIHHHLAFYRLKLRRSASQLPPTPVNLFAQLCVTIFCSWGQAEGLTQRYCRWSGSPPVSLPTILSSLAPMTSSAGQVLQYKYISMVCWQTGIVWNVCRCQHYTLVTQKQSQKHKFRFHYKTCKKETKNILFCSTLASI